MKPAAKKEIFNFVKSNENILRSYGVKRNRKMPLFASAIIFFAALLFTRCDWTFPADFIQIRVQNHTDEAIIISTGKIFIDVTIDKDIETLVVVVKNAPLYAEGKTSGKRYAVRTFYADNETWSIHK